VSDPWTLVRENSLEPRIKNDEFADKIHGEVAIAL